MASTQSRRQPSNYPFPVTYIVAFFVFASAAIVAGILSYFIYYLRMDSMSVPYQFIFLIFIACGTLLSVMFSTYSHVFGIKHPQVSLITNTILLTAWLAGLGLITGKIGDMVLGHACSTKMWRTDMGVMVCRIYKALYSFIVIGTASIAGAAILDVSVLREQSKRGAYREMKDKDQTQGQKISSATSALRSGFGLRGGNYVELKESPDLRSGGADDGDMGQRLIGRSPEQSDRGSEWGQTPKL